MPLLFQEIVDGDLLADHRLALGHRARLGLAADVAAPSAARSSASAHQCTWPPAAFTLVSKRFKIDVEIGEGVILDRARVVAQRLELRQPRGRAGALGDEVLLHMGHRLLQLRVAQRPVGVVLEGVAGGRVHAGVPSAARRADRRRLRSMPASTSATWRAATGRPSRGQLAGDVEQAAHIAGQQRYRRRWRRCRRSSPAPSGRRSPDT